MSSWLKIVRSVLAWPHVSCGYSRLLSVARRDHSVSTYHQPQMHEPKATFVACSAECTYDADGAGGVNNIHTP